MEVGACKSEDEAAEQTVGDGAMLEVDFDAWGEGVA